VTNFHVVDQASAVEIVLSEKSSVQTHDLISYSREHDLAIIPIGTAGKALPLSNRKPEVGDRIITVGNPAGFQRTLSEGLISGIRELGGATVYQMTAPISPGSSGGPIVDETGNVVGVTSFTVVKSQNLNFAIPSSDVIELLKHPSPTSLSKLPQSHNNAELVFGKGGLEIVKLTKTGSVIGLSIKNTTQGRISAILVRIFYSEPPPESLQIGKLQQYIAYQSKLVNSQKEARAAIEKQAQALGLYKF